MTLLPDSHTSPGPNGKPGVRRYGLLSILMPIYNERRTLRRVIERVLASPIPLPVEIIAVDDCSQDGSAEILRELAAKDGRIKAFFHKQNHGKGGAIHTAIANLTGDIALIQDADLEYDPAEIPRVLAPILEGKADVVFGSRFAGGEARRVLYYWHGLGNRLLTWLCNVVCDLNLTDMETCYKAIRTDILKHIRLKFNRFGLEPELTIRLAQWRARIYEVPISYAGRTYREGKKITWRDGFRALAAILWCGLIQKRFTNHDGYYILAAVRNAERFNAWMFEQLQRYVGQRILEAGCGIGNLTELMLDRDRIICADIDPIYTEIIDRRFGYLESFRCLQIDLARDTDFEQLNNEDLDTIICLNVLEHIADDRATLRQFLHHLRPGGHTIILVPQHPWLYTRVDRTLGHERRYTEAELREKMERAGFELVHVQGFNKLGTLGWFLSGFIFRHQHLTPRQMNLFNRLLPFARLVERLPGLPAQSLLVVGRKRLPDESPADQVEELAVSIPGALAP